MSAPWQGWHFLPSDGRLCYGDGRAPQDGEDVSAEGPLVLCERGMHASADILDCLKYAPGPILCRVELRGKRIDGGDKSVARTRVILWRIDATAILRRFAYWCADRAVRVHAVAALRRAGDVTLTRRADTLAALPEIVDETTARHAYDAAAAAAFAACCATYTADTAYAAYVTAHAAAAAAAFAAAPAFAASDAAYVIAQSAAAGARASERDIQRSKLLSMIEEARHA